MAFGEVAEEPKSLSHQGLDLRSIAPGYVAVNLVTSDRDLK